MISDADQELPLLTEVADETPDELPILFEIIPDEPAALTSAKNKAVRALNADEMQQLLEKLTIHLETIFTNKLNQQLEELQRLTVDMAVSELKAELPQLLRDALKTTDPSGKS